MLESDVTINVGIRNHERIPTCMHSLINSGNGGPCCVVIRDLDDSSFDELVSDVPRWVGEVTDSCELNTKVLTNVNTDIT